MKIKQLVISALRRSLPRRVRRGLVNLGFNLDRDQFQYLASEYLFAPDMPFGLKSFANRGFTPTAILDIGAFEGNWSKMAMKIWPSAKLALVEANPKKAAALRRDLELANAVVIESLLGATDASDVSFYIMESGSSVLEEHSDVERERVSLKQRTLDSVAQGLPTPDLIKIDVQGYELEVLRGGKQTLAKAQAVLVELSLIEVNDGAPLLDEALNFMRTAGFVAYDVLEIHRRPLDGAMNQIDVLFVREDSRLRADKRHWS
jgi:FkbM family methyltransferase